MKIKKNYGVLSALEQGIPVVQETKEGQLKGGFVALDTADGHFSASWQFICTKQNGCQNGCVGTPPTRPTKPTATPTPTPTPTSTKVVAMGFPGAGSSLFF